jgi:lysophospholipid acyltransferase (LPLAT)-like uncharacterized protein
LAAMAEHLGYATFGISAKPDDPENVRGTMQLIQHIRKGHDGVIAGDGPSGPYHVLKPGVFTIAKRSGVLIVPVGVWYRHKITLKTRWDHYQIPLPFTRCVIALDAQIPGTGRSGGEGYGEFTAISKQRDG